MCVYGADCDSQLLRCCVPGLKFVFLYLGLMSNVSSCDMARWLIRLSDEIYTRLTLYALCELVSVVWKFEKWQGVNSTYRVVEFPYKT